MTALTQAAAKKMFGDVCGAVVGAEAKGWDVKPECGTQIGPIIQLLSGEKT